MVDDELRLQVIAGDNVSNGAQGGSLHGRGGIEEEINETTSDGCFNDGLDLLVGSVREVGECPAGIREYLLVWIFNEFGKGWQGCLDKIKVGLRLASTKVGQGPSSISKHG